MSHSCHTHPRLHILHRCQVMVVCPSCLHVHSICINMVGRPSALMVMQVGVSDISLKGRLRTTLIPLLFDMPVVGAVQVGTHTTCSPCWYCTITPCVAPCPLPPAPALSCACTLFPNTCTHCGTLPTPPAPRSSQVSPSFLSCLPPLPPLRSSRGASTISCHAIV